MCKNKNVRVFIGIIIAIIFSASFVGCAALTAGRTTTAALPTENSSLNTSDTVNTFQQSAGAISIDSTLPTRWEREVREKYQGLLDDIPQESFEIREPYIIFSSINFNDFSYRYENINENPSFYVVLYSGGDTVDDYAVNNAGTLIYARPVRVGSQHFVTDAGGGQISFANQMTVYSYSIDIYYYDTASNSIIGYDRIAAPEIPERISSNANSNERQRHMKPSDREIIEVVAARLNDLN